VPDDPRRDFAKPSPRDGGPTVRPFPPVAYVLGWLAICIVAAEGVNAFISGLYGSAVILLCMVPAMIWLMHIRPRQMAKRRRG
jgi:hypothetical protein